MALAIRNVTWATLDCARNCTLAQQYINLKYEDHRQDTSWRPSKEEQLEYFVAWLPPQYDAIVVTLEDYQNWTWKNNWVGPRFEEAVRNQCLEDRCESLYWRIDPDIWGIGVSLM